MSIEFLVAPQRISPDCGVGAWTRANLSGYGLPAAATGAVIRYTGGDAQVHGITFRKPGQTATGIVTDMNLGGHYWCIVPVVNQEIEAFRDHASVEVYLDGYSGLGWHFLDVPVSLTAGLVVDNWNTIDISAYAPGAIGVIFEADGGGWSWRFRPNGSIFIGADQASMHGYGVCGVDPAQKWQIYPTSFGGALLLNISVIGYITERCAFRTNFDDLSLGVTGSYEDIDITAHLSGYNAALVLLHSTSGNTNWDLRANGSARDWQRFASNKNFGVVKLDDSDIFEGFIANLATDFFLIGAARGSPKGFSQAHVCS